MRLDGIDHITGITSEGQRCLDFYAGILGLAFLGRDPDFEAPDSHLIRLGHRRDRPQGVLTFIEAPGIRRGIAGNGMTHLLRWTVPLPAALEYWARRLSEAGIDVRPLQGEGGSSLRFADPEGLEHELGVESVCETAALACGSREFGHTGGRGCRAPTSSLAGSRSASQAPTAMRSAPARGARSSPSTRRLSDEAGWAPARSTTSPGPLTGFFLHGDNA